MYSFGLIVYQLFLLMCIVRLTLSSMMGREMSMKASFTVEIYKGTNHKTIRDKGMSASYDSRRHFEKNTGLYKPWLFTALTRLDFNLSIYLVWVQVGPCFFSQGFSWAIPWTQWQVSVTITIGWFFIWTHSRVRKIENGICTMDKWDAPRRLG